ncbi:hypothetical protein N657DRAFT_467455 [Parathielavia appendiculata]|uniref:Uncharacterized protein n=1 Tax=Parathielavia appendiculata TaxID=2587402 RepID=A0AAN6TYN0_9PEZI|nr:hypothetical protein N657DRAFT_467455 [Parathielavia appendiculata]
MGSAELLQTGWATPGRSFIRTCRLRKWKDRVCWPYLIVWVALPNVQVDRYVPLWQEVNGVGLIEIIVDTPDESGAGVLRPYHMWITRMPDRIMAHLRLFANSEPV